MRALAILLAACGDNAAALPDAAPAVDAAAGCTATWTGNFAESAAVACPAIAADGTLTLAVGATQLVDPLAVTIALGAATPGTYSSETVATWHASGAGGKVEHMCFYVAGSDVVPHGSFLLDYPHRLDLQLAVLAQPFTYCGDGNTEQVAITFP